MKYLNLAILALAIAHATFGWLVLAPLLAFVLYRVLEPFLRHLRQGVR